MAADQGYCLECGTRRLQGRSQFLSSVFPGTRERVVREELPAEQAIAAPVRGAHTIMAGVGVLLLAMGVGVLIGRAGGNSRPVAQAPAVVSVAGGGATAADASATFNDDWPAGTSGYTVRLQSLPAASTQPGAVVAAKSAATAKGAKDVGALKSDNYPSLTAGSFIVYSGVFDTRAKAKKALASLRAKFPDATVVQISGGSGSSGAGSGSTPNKAAPALKSLRSGGGKAYEQKSKNLPKQLSTGGAPPPKDNVAPGGGQGGGVSIG